MFGQKVVLASLGLICLFGFAWPYGISALAPVYETAPESYGYAPGIVSDVAAAKASASKIHSVHWPAVNQYGHEIGQPLLVKNYGQLTSLYSALVPKRSFVGTIDSGFYKDRFGNLKFRDEAVIGALAV